MKSSRSFLAAFFAACFLTVAAFAADPAGTWTWSSPGRDGQTFESTLKLEMKDGKLTGTLAGRMGETPIQNASVKEDGTIAFSMEREFNGNKIVTKYSGKLDGDVIKGETETERNGEVMKREWLAKRAK